MRPGKSASAKIPAASQVAQSPTSSWGAIGDESPLFFLAAFGTLFASRGQPGGAVPTARLHHRAPREPPLKRNSDNVGLRQRRRGRDRDHLRQRASPALGSRVCFNFLPLSELVGSGRPRHPKLPTRRFAGRPGCDPPSRRPASPSSRLTNPPLIPRPIAARGRRQVQGRRRDCQQCVPRRAPITHIQLF